MATTFIAHKLALPSPRRTQNKICTAKAAGLTPAMYAPAPKINTDALINNATRVAGAAAIGVAGAMFVSGAASPAELPSAAVPVYTPGAAAKPMEAACPPVLQHEVATVSCLAFKDMSFLPPKLLSTPGRPSPAMRYPQVLCIISQHTWFPLYNKVLEVVEQLLKQTTILNQPDSNQDLPFSHPAGQFLTALCQQCPNPPVPGRVFRVEYPKTERPLEISAGRRIGGFSSTYDDPLLASTEHYIELEVPPDSGNGSWNAGIALAPLLYYFPQMDALLSLLAAMLLERRIIVVASDRERVTSAVHAAAAMLYPFRWQHIYLPLLPTALRDYLTAPMPFLIGLPSELMPMLKHMPMNEVVLVNLEQGTVDPPGGAAADDARRLPWSDRLRSALEMVHSSLRSPTEFESTPVIGHLMQEYFLKLLGRYRDFIMPEDVYKAAAAAASVSGRRDSGTGVLPSPRTIRARPSFRHTSSVSSRLRGEPDDDDSLIVAGYRFDHAGFVASHRGSEQAQEFLQMFRHSQMFEVFITERLQMAADDYKTTDAFEAKVVQLAARRSKGSLGRGIAAASSKSYTNLQDMLQKGKTLVKRFANEHMTPRDTGGEDSEFWPHLADSAPASRMVQGSSQSVSGRFSSFTGRPAMTRPPPSISASFSVQRSSPTAESGHFAIRRDSPGLAERLSEVQPSSPNRLQMASDINSILHQGSVTVHDAPAALFPKPGAAAPAQVRSASA
eukprot:jgi/Astpho2/4797/Aster-00342